MKIVLLPLDERPCNLKYPSLLPLHEDIQVVTPPKNILSHKKERCDLGVLHTWLIKECKDADYLIVSMDTLLYGGIVPSRLHHDSSEEIISRAGILNTIKENNQNIKIYANELIMRTPSYSYADEEPDYFDECGRELWLYGVYLDKDLQGDLSDEEREEFNYLKETLNKDYLIDLMKRREINKIALFNTIDLYKEGVIDYLIIPQDDCHPYGFTSKDRRELVKYIEKVKLEKELLLYPGADEAGLTLMSRVMSDFFDKKLKIYVVFASEKGKTSIPCFEDRPLINTILTHLKANNLIHTENYEEADLVLFVNNGDFFVQNNTPQSIEMINFSRDLKPFIEKMKKAYNDGKVIGIADNIFCNMGDEMLFDELFENELFEVIHSYAGWNTSSNTLDTTISAMVAYYFSREDVKKNIFLLHRFVEDFFYMGCVRDEIIKKIESNPKWGIKINALNQYKAPLSQLAKERLERLIYKYQLNNLCWVNSINVDFVWNRTFEIDLIIE